MGLDNGNSNTCEVHLSFILLKKSGINSKYIFTSTFQRIAAGNETWHKNHVPVKETELALVSFQIRFSDIKLSLKKAQNILDFCRNIYETRNTSEQSTPVQWGLKYCAFFVENVVLCVVRWRACTVLSNCFTSATFASHHTFYYQHVCILV